MAVVFSYFLMSLRENQLEKFCLNSILNLETVCQDIDTRWNVFSLSKSECSTQPIQRKFCRNRKLFSQFFSPFPKSKLHFEYFEEKMSLRGDFFLKL